MATETRTVGEVIGRSLSRPLPAEEADLKLPPKPSEIDDDHPASNGDREVRMTFDHDFEPPRELHSTLAPLSIYPGERTPSPPQRPELKTSVTMPTSASPHFDGMNLEHNAWADDEDDFSKEKEMKMTFE
jgi:hypothetical protein